MTNALDIFNNELSHDAEDDRNILRLIETVRKGIAYAIFIAIVSRGPFTLPEWSGFLHISERTLQRYKKEARTFDALQSEKILQIVLLYSLGTDVFGSKDQFNSWLDSDNIALGKIKPKSLLDNAFGINLLKDELTRIEHGVLA